MTTGPAAEAAGARDPRVARAEGHIARGEVLQAELLLLAVLRERPADTAAAITVAELALRRDDTERAVEFLDRAASAVTAPRELMQRAAQAWWQLGRPDRAEPLLRRMLAADGSDPREWLLLGEVLETLGASVPAAKARFQAFSRANARGRWRNEADVEPHLRPLVGRAGQKLLAARREAMFASLDASRAAFGGEALKRVEFCLRAYLGEVPAAPSHPRQAPKFLYFPGLPDAGFHDPHGHPWAATLAANWPAIRDEALAVIAEGSRVQPFLEFKPGDRREDYVAGPGGGDGGPAWDAYFFWRHGQRFDEHHARCPVTSGLLESIELCRIEQQAPEICFSVLRPGSHIQPHHGTTNTRLVMHLPLVVPPDCALNLPDVGTHAWREGEPMLFDDTFLHEAWNRSTGTRTILLMDCWNPHLTPPERSALKALVEAIDGFENRP
jgi:aspartate beta-hydroxylase